MAAEDAAKLHICRKCRSLALSVEWIISSTTTILERSVKVGIQNDHFSPQKVKNPHSDDTWVLRAFPTLPNDISCLLALPHAQPGIFQAYQPGRNYIFRRKWRKLHFLLNVVPSWSPESSLWIPPPPGHCDGSFLPLCPCGCWEHLGLSTLQDMSKSLAFGSFFSFSDSELLEGRGQRLAGCWHSGHSVHVAHLDHRVVLPCCVSELSDPWTALVLSWAFRLVFNNLIYWNSCASFSFGKKEKISLIWRLR